MKIPISKDRKEFVACGIGITVYYFAMFISFFFPRADEFPGGFWEYAADNWDVWIMGVIVGLSFIGIPIVTMTEYEVRPEGLYVLPRYGKNSFIPWTDLKYVGPIKRGFRGGCPNPLICSPEYPYKDKHGCCALAKGTVVIDYSPEAEYALKSYCPIYSTKFENWKIGVEPFEDPK